MYIMPDSTMTQVPITNKMSIEPDDVNTAGDRNGGWLAKHYDCWMYDRVGGTV
jgi:hypothetical protein